MYNQEINSKERHFLFTWKRYEGGNEPNVPSKFICLAPWLAPLPPSFSTTWRFTPDSDPCQVCKYTNVNPPLIHQTLTTGIVNFTSFPSINIWQFFTVLSISYQRARVQNSNSKYLMPRWSEAILKSVRRWIEWGSCIGSLINYTRGERDVCCSNTGRIMV